MNFYVTETPTVRNRVTAYFLNRKAPFWINIVTVALILVTYLFFQLLLGVTTNGFLYIVGGWLIGAAAAYLCVATDREEMKIGLIALAICLVGVGTVITGAVKDSQQWNKQCAAAHGHPVNYDDGQGGSYTVCITGN